MSAPLLRADILFGQRLLASAGFYKGALDGMWGKKTEAAETAFAAFYEEQRKKFGLIDSRSEGCIATLLPKAQVIARKFMEVAKQAPFTVKILSGTRTYAQQNALYAQGRTTPGKIVTKAKGGHSNHNFGIAWDVGIFVDGVYYTGRTREEERAYDDLAKLIKPHFEGVLAWGGDWKFTDKPHYQLVEGNDVGKCRAALEAGKPYV